MSKDKNHDNIEKQLAKKYQKRDRRKTKKMKVSGKSTLNLQKIIANKKAR